MNRMDERTLDAVARLARTNDGQSLIQWLRASLADVDAQNRLPILADSGGNVYVAGQAFAIAQIVMAIETAEEKVTKARGAQVGVK